MRILFFLLFPIFLSAQINRAYGVIEIGATFPTSSSTGPKFAYRTVDSSFYRWVSGSTWIKIIPDEFMPLDSLVFTPTTSEPDTAELKYSADLETFWFGADGTTIEIGQKTAWYVKNQSGGTITKGTVVRAVGTLGSSGRILIDSMVIDGSVPARFLLGIAASDIANGSDGYVIHFGKLRKLNTNAWNEGDVLYAGAGGTLTNVEPSPPNLRLPIAFVVRKSTTQGVLAIRIQTGNELHELHDVDTSGIDDGGVLVWNGTKWGASDGVAITTADTTSLLATKYWTNTNFFPILGGTLTGTGGAGFVGFPSQVVAPGTPASGLNVYAQGSSFNWKGTDGFERQFASTLTGGRTYTLPNVSGTFALGTGTADQSVRWSATNTLAAGNFIDNGTKLQALLPFQLQSYTTAGLPTGVTGYNVYNSTLADQIYYNTSGWYYTTPWKQSTSSSNVFLNSGSAIINTSSVINSNYNLQVNGSATFRNASFTTNEALSGFLDVRGGTMTGLSGTTHGLAGINLSGIMSFNTFNQTFYGIRLNLTTNATASQSVFPFWMHYSANTEGQMQVNNTVGASSFKIGGQNQTNFVTIKTPAGGTGGSALPGITFRAAAGYTWAATGANNGFAINSNPSGTDPNSVNATLLVRGYRTMIGTIISQTPNATLEIQGEGTTSSTKAFLVQNSGRANNAFTVLDDGTSIFGASSGGTGAIVTFTSTTQGILPPRWTAAQRIAISSAATGLLGYQTDGTEGLYVKYASGWKRHLVEGDVPTVNIYTGDGTFGSSRIGTLTDSLRFQYGGSDLFRLKSNGVLHVNMPTESNSFVITSTPSENYNNYRGNVFLTGTSSTGDTTTGSRRNNHEASYFSGINLVEGGNNVYYDAVSGYGNIVRGNSPKNIITGVYNTVTGLGDVGVYGYGNTVSAQYVTIVGRENTVTANNTFIVGRNNTVNTPNAFVYGNSIGSTNATLHGFGTVAPTARMHIKSVTGAATLFVDGGYAQIDAKVKIGSDSSFVHNPTTDTTYIKGSTRIQAGNLTVEKTSGTPYLNILAAAGSGNQEAGIYLRSRGSFAPIIEFDAASSTSSGRSLGFYNYNTASGGRQVFIIGAGLGQFGARSIGQFVVYDTLNTTQRFSFNSNGTSIFSSYGAGTKESADLSKTQSNYIAGFATDGTVLDYSLSNLPNGIYTGSGTLASHTTRALIPANGNLFFTQKYNANADSAFLQFLNFGDGERSLYFGLTDTSSTGYVRGNLYTDGAGAMNWALETSDVYGATSIGAVEGNVAISSGSGNVSLSVADGQEVVLSGIVRAKQEGYYEINSTSSPQNLSNTYSDNFINQGSTQATFTLVFPASPADGQILKITYNNNISSLTLDGNGNTIVGTTVTTAVEGSQRVFKFYAGEGVWIRQN